MTIMVDIMVMLATVDGLLIIMHPGIDIILIIGPVDHHTVAWGIIVQVTQDVVGADSTDLLRIKEQPYLAHLERTVFEKMLCCAFFKNRSFNLHSNSTVFQDVDIGGESFGFFSMCYSLAREIYSPFRVSTFTNSPV